MKIENIHSYKKPMNGQRLDRESYVASEKSKAMKSSPLLRPFCGSEFWGFCLLKI